MKNSQEFTLLQKDIAHLYSMHLATIRTEYKIIRLSHQTQPPFFPSPACWFYVAQRWLFLCTLYIMYFYCISLCLVATLIYCS